MIVLAETLLEAQIAERALRAAAHVLGDSAPDGLADLRVIVLPASRRHSLPFAATGAAPSDLVAHDAPVTYRQAALAINRSVRTVGRLVERRELVKVGRLVTAASVRQYVGAQ